MNEPLIRCTRVCSCFPHALVLFEPIVLLVKTATTDFDFQTAFAHHVSLQDHHLLYWNKHHPGVHMSDAAAVEMVADWFAANWGYNGEWPMPGTGNWTYMTRQKFDAKNFPDNRSRAICFAVLCVCGFERELFGDSAAERWERAAREEELGPRLTTLLRQRSR